MDKKKADGHRVHFAILVGSTPRLICGADDRWGIVIVNENTLSLLRVGFSGTVATLGIGIPAGQSLSDTYSVDEYWAVYGSGLSGTVSGFYIR